MPDRPSSCTRTFQAQAIIFSMVCTLVEDPSLPGPFQWVSPKGNDKQGVLRAADFESHGFPVPIKIPYVQSRCCISGHPASQLRSEASSNRITLRMFPKAPNNWFHIFMALLPENYNLTNRLDGTFASLSWRPFAEAIFLAEKCSLD